MNYKHGKRRSKIYSLWSSMIGRCTNESNGAFPNYGGRGIGVCVRWLDFQAFYSDMGDPPTGLTLERTNNDLGYSPDNCRWATRKEQARNRRSFKTMNIDGVERTMTEWSEISGISVPTIWARIKYGWSAKAAVFMPKVPHKNRNNRGGGVLAARNQDPPVVWSDEMGNSQDIAQAKFK